MSTHNRCFRIEINVKVMFLYNVKVGFKGGEGRNYILFNSMMLSCDETEKTMAF